MGEIIRKTAAIEDLEKAVIDTLTNARARGGVWQKHAEDRLGATEAILLKIKTDREAIEKALAPLVAHLATINVKADRFIGEKADEIWNKLGRPGYDPIYSLMFPEGISTYTDVDDEEQPDYMELLADLIASGIHPRLDLTYAKGIGTELRAIADEYRAGVQPILPLNIKLKLLAKTRATVARSGQVQLSNLKRLYRAEGFSEAEVHQVIPDRPNPSKK